MCIRDRRQLSFSLVMAMFTAAMVTLVLADDLVLLFVAWELTSIASFLLIARSGHPGEAASMRTMLLTFIGGLALLAAVGAMAVRLGTTSLSAVLADPVWRDDPGFTAAMAVLVPVSYTHLDVYKRQTLRGSGPSRGSPRWRRGCSTCLLYTSRCV